TSDKGISVKKKWTFTDNTLIYDIVVLGTSGYSAANCTFACVENTYVSLVTNPVSKCPDHNCRRSRQHGDPALTIACHIGPQQDIMVWGAIFFHSWTPFGNHFWDTNSTAVH
ncbi:hypothetical protein TNCV_2304401, partial [Trichonephila clavipes]